jgi:hypothetical protein
LERQLAAAQQELRTARKHSEDVANALDAERERAMDDHRLWSGELRALRRFLERQSEMLVSLGAVAARDAAENGDVGDAGDGRSSPVGAGHVDGNAGVGTGASASEGDANQSNRRLDA